MLTSSEARECEHNCKDFYQCCSCMEGGFCECLGEKCQCGFYCNECVKDLQSENGDLFRGCRNGNFCTDCGPYLKRLLTREREANAILEKENTSLKRECVVYVLCECVCMCVLYIRLFFF